MNRREFLKATAGAGIALSVLNSGYVAYAADAKPLRVGIIGPGWYGKIDLLRLIQVSPVEVVSMCDVDKKMLSDAAAIVAGRQANKKTPRTYADYREMLKEKDLDLCLIGTPDHQHALNAIAAMEAGCDLYLQKPISVDVLEGKAILDAARRLNKVVQIGTQRRSTPHLVEAKEKVIDAGLLGKIAYVECCCYYHMRNNTPASQAPDIAPPANLDWDMWTGPAPMRGYNRIVHPRGWRAFMEYGNGIVGDMCVHMYDMTRWMLGLGWPTRVSSEGGILVAKGTKANISDTQTAAFDHPEVKVVWTHRTWGKAADPDPKYAWSTIFYGDKGTLKASVNGYEFIPDGKSEATLKGEPLFEYDKFPEDRTEKDLERHVASAVRWHMQDLLKNIASRGKPVADIEQGYMSTASCILANMSMKLGRSLAFDPVKMEVTGDPEATKLLAREYRAPWKHPGMNA
jgi:predicted dehydrogenase